MDSVVSIRDKYVLNTYLLNPIPEKDWIVWIIMPIKPDTFLGVCNTPLPIPDKCLINMYLLNLIPGNGWIVRVGSYCIRHTNAHDHGQMIDSPDTFWGLCNTLLPIQYKYLINTYLLNLIPDKDWMVRVGAYCIRPTNTHDHGLMIDPSDTCGGVCNTPLPIRDKYLINTYLLNLIPDKDWIICVESYCIRCTNTNDHWQMIDPPDTFRVVCNTPLSIPDKFLINTHLLNPILGKYWIVRVGAYCIRPTNANNHGQMIDSPGTCWGVCNMPLPIRDKYLINMHLLNLIPVSD